MSRTAPRWIESLAAMILIVAMALFVWLGTRDLDRPWEGGFRGANGAFYVGNFVKHWSRFGVAYTRGGGVMKAVPVNPPRVLYDFHHPPLYPLLVHPVVAVRGLSEANIRLGALLLAAPALLFLYLIGRQLSHPLAGALAALLYTLAPMGGYFGPMVVTDTFAVTLSLATVWAFLREEDAPTLLRRALTFLFLFLLALTDWPGYWTGPVLALIALTGRNPIPRFWRVLRLAAAPILGFLVYAVHTGWIQKGDDAEASIVRAFLAEFSHLSTVMTVANPTLSQVVAAVAKYSLAWFGVPLLLLAASSPWLKPAAETSRRALQIAAFLVVPGLLNAVVFQRNLVVHDYWILHSLPGLALLGGLAMEGALGRGWASKIAILAWLSLMGVQGVQKTLDEIASHRTETHVLNAKYVNEVAKPGDVILTSEAFDVESWYLDQFVMPHATTPEAFVGAYTTWQANRWAGTRLIMFVQKDREATPLVAALRRFGPPLDHHHFLVWIFDH